MTKHYMKVVNTAFSQLSNKYA